MQQDMVMSERVKQAEQVIADDLRRRYPAFAGKTRVPRPALVAEALAYTLVHPPAAEQLAGYLEQFAEDRADVAHNRGGSFLTNAALTATMRALHEVLIAQLGLGTREWLLLHNHHGGANQRAVYYVALRTMADAVSAEGQGNVPAIED